MTDLDYIKQFSKITIKSICEENGVNSSNLWSGRVPSHKVKLIRKSIECEVSKLDLLDYIDYKEDINGK